MGVTQLYRRPLRGLLLAVCVVTVILVLVSIYTQNPTGKLKAAGQSALKGADSVRVKLQAGSAVNSSRGGNRHDESGFVVDTPFCKIPDVNPFDDSIRNIIEKPYAVSCGRNDDLTIQEGNELMVNRAAARRNYRGNFKECCYRGFARVAGSDDAIKYFTKETCFNDRTTIPFQFVKVVCFNDARREVYRNFHAFVTKNPPYPKRKDDNSKDDVNVKEKLNVLVMGIDSVSRLNFIRQMPQTRNFLLKELGAIELKGYNKVADNTFVNIVPMFTGKYLEELPWDESKSMEPFDKHPMAWKNFSSRGYTTLFAEDYPKIAIFNYLKFGFRTPPTHHYLRPFTLAMAAERAKWHEDDYCFGARLETDIVLRYTIDFAKTYADMPYFGLTFLTRMTHAEINDAGSADIPHLRFLQTMKEENLLNNTVLFYMSDHGARFGSILSTYIGKLEERLPLMYVVFPEWFHKKYPKISENLSKNSGRLTTPFDIHATFAHLLNFDGLASKANPKDRSISLLKEIPAERTCESASILPHWCACQNAKPIDSKSKEALVAGEAVVEQINNETRAKRDICVPFTLQEVTDAMKMQADNKVLTFRQSLNDVMNRKVFYGQRARDAIVSYLLTVKVSPGGGMFEATVRYDEHDKTYQVMGDMSRIDKYGNTSHCVDAHRLKKYCLCSDYAAQQIS